MLMYTHLLEGRTYPRVNELVRDFWFVAKTEINRIIQKIKIYKSRKNKII